MSQPQGFAFEQRNGGAVVVITHHGRIVATLRAPSSQRFLEEVAAGDPQLVMARWTGNYRRGNERISEEHLRNRNRRHR